jgi:response regulator RpfG family c-di-GMP phosphodiesterase
MTATVLIVEDVLAIQEALVRLVGRRHAVLSCASAEEALEILRREKQVALVIADHGLPGMDGLELLGLMRRECSGTVGLLLTGEKNFDLAVRAVNEGSLFRFLTKPCAEDELLEAVEEGLVVYRLGQEERERTGRLRFACESLGGFTDMLEGRLAVQVAAMRRLHTLAMDLNNTNSLQEIADSSAQAAWELLDVTGVSVHIVDPRHPDFIVDAQVGNLDPATAYREELRSADGGLGEILVASPSGSEPGTLRAHDRGKLNLLVASTAVASHNEMRRHERDAAQQAAILALAGLAERRDHETGGHLERVAAFCRTLAEGLVALGHHADYITEEFIDHLVRSSPLHDIGKVGIPDSILLNPGKLTLEEEAVMRTHTIIGAETLEAVMEDGDAHSFLAMGRDIARGHHEKWDGSGYPYGISGDAIPLSARILALADVYDALTSERRYKLAWEHDRVVPWITALSGRQFDPQVVAAFLHCQGEFNSIRARLSDVACALPGVGEANPHSADSALDAS